VRAACARDQHVADLVVAHVLAQGLEGGEGVPELCPEHQDRPVVALDQREARTGPAIGREVVLRQEVEVVLRQKVGQRP